MRYLSFTLLFMAIGTLQAADWNQWRGPSRNGFVEHGQKLIEGLPEAGLQPVWKSEPIKSARDGGWSCPVISNGKVYLYTHQRSKLKDLGKRKYPWFAFKKNGAVTAKEYQEYEVKRRNEQEQRAKAFKFDEVVYCFNLETGEVEWKNEKKTIYTRWPQSGSPVVVEEKIYFLGAGRTVRCLNTANGNDIWNSKLPGSFRDEFYQSSVVVADGIVAVMASQLFGLDINTGDIRWTGDEKTIKGSHSSPATWKFNEKEFLIVNLSGGRTACLNLADGKELWRIDSQTGVSSPTVIGDLLITYGNSRKKGMRCFKMSRESAEPMWVFHGTSDKGSCPVIVGDYAYVQGERRLACVNLKTGKAEWQTTLNLRRPQYTSLIAVNKTVFYANDGLLAFRAIPDAFQPLIQAKFDETGLMATEKTLRQKYKLDALEKEKNGLQKAEKLYKQKISSHAPLDCCTPAFSNGYLFLRFKNHLACYDLSAQPVGEKTTSR